VVSDAYALNINWADVLFERAIKDGNEEYVVAMATDCNRWTSDVFRAVVDRCPFLIVSA